MKFGSFTDRIILDLFVFATVRMRGRGAPFAGGSRGRLVGGFPREGDPHEGPRERGDVAGVCSVAVVGDAAGAGAQGEGAAGARGDLANHREAAAASDLAGPRHPHLERVA